MFCGFFLIPGAQKNVIHFFSNFVTKMQNRAKTDFFISRQSSSEQNVASKIYLKNIKRLCDMFPWQLPCITCQSCISNS